VDTPFFPCLNCLADGVVELKFDKKGRPYSTCRSCGTRAFMRSFVAMRGLMLLAPQLVQVWKEMIRSVNGNVVQLDENVREQAEAHRVTAEASNG